MRDELSVARQFARQERVRRREGKASTLVRIGTKHLTRIHELPPNRLLHGKTQYAGFAESSGTSAGLMTALRHDEGKVILRDLPHEHYVVFDRYLRWLVDFLIHHDRNAALAAAAEAEQAAADAKAAANRAKDRTRDVAGASTNEQAESAVDAACAAAQQAQAAHQRAVDAASRSCAHAGAVPDDVQAQDACSRSRAAAAAAEAASNEAHGACTRAEDIASIGIVTVCGHVTEEDPCCNDNANGVSISVCNEAYPEIPCQGTQTDGNGNYCVTGRFGPSSRVGPARVRVEMDSGSGWGNVRDSRVVTVNSSNPPRVDFSFDAPGWE